jgi:CRISPR system Cascade subunit CasE
MYLTLISLDCMDRTAMRTLADVYRQHQLVMSGFAGYDRPSRVLFRVEPERRDGAVRLLVQSQVRPAYDVSDQPGKGLIGIHTKEFKPRLIRGNRFRFRLRANPVVTKDGKRRGLVRDEALLDWLRKKEEQIGVHFASALAIDEGYITGTRRKGERAERVNIKAARFEGVLEVVDAGRFIEALTSGIGHAKAFGFGLLSLAKV